MLDSILLPLLADTARLLSAFVLLILPGAAFCLNIARKDISWPEYASISITSGLTINLITLFSANYLLGKPIIASAVIAASLSTTLLFLAVRLISALKSGRKISVKNIITPQLAEHGFFESAILIAAIVFITYLGLGVHSKYNLPYHMDEWLHISLAVQIDEERGLKFVDPNYPPKLLSDRPDYSSHRLEAGYHILLAAFYTISGVDPVTSVSYLPALVTALTCLSMYSLVFALTKNFRPAFYSIIFFTGLKSSQSLLGPWFLVPQSMGFSFIYLVLFCFEKGRKGMLRMHYVGMLNLLGAALIHPQTAALLYVVIAVYSLIISLGAMISLAKGSGTIRSRAGALYGEYKGFIVGAVLYLLFPLTGFVYFFKILWAGSLWDTVNYFFKDYIFFKTMLEIKILYTLNYPLEHYKSISAAFFVLGLLAIILGRKHALLFSGVAPCFAILALYHYKGYTVFIAYERLLYYLFIFMVPVSGLGLWYALNFMEKKLAKFAVIQYISSLIVLALAINMVYVYYAPQKQLPVLLTASEFNAVKWLPSYAGKNNIVLARERISNAVYPASGNKVLAMTPRGTGYSKQMTAIYSFFMSDCTGKKTILSEYSVDYVIDDQKLKCDFLKEVYSQDNIKVYEVTL